MKSQEQVTVTTLPSVALVASVVGTVMHWTTLVVGPRVARDMIAHATTGNPSTFTLTMTCVFLPLLFLGLVLGVVAVVRTTRGASSPRSSVIAGAAVATALTSIVGFALSTSAQVALAFLTGLASR